MDLLVVIGLTGLIAAIIWDLFCLEAKAQVKVTRHAPTPLPAAYGPGGTTTKHPEELGWPDTSPSSQSPSGDRIT